MKKVEFEKYGEEVEVLADGEQYGTLKFGDEEFGTQKGIWILWYADDQDAVSYFSDLKETEEAIKDELSDAE